MMIDGLVLACYAVVAGVWLVRAVVDPFVALIWAGGDGVEVTLQDFAPELPTSQRLCRRRFGTLALRLDQELRS